VLRREGVKRCICPGADKSIALGQSRDQGVKKLLGAGFWNSEFRQDLDKVKPALPRTGTAKLLDQPRYLSRTKANVSRLKVLQQPGGSDLCRWIRPIGERDELVDCRGFQRQRLSNTKKGIQMLAVKVLEPRLQLRN